MNTFLRNLKESDINFLFEIENDQNLWKFSDQKNGFSRQTLKKYIKIASRQNLFQANQIRFVIENIDSKVVGFIDLFDYNSEKKNAYIGIVILKKFRNKGFAFEAVKLLEQISKNNFGIIELKAIIKAINIKSIKLFEKSGYKKTVNNTYQKKIIDD